MKGRSAIPVYCKILLIQSILMAILLLPSLGWIRCRMYADFYVVQSKAGFYFFSDPQDEDAIHEWFDDPALIEMGHVMLRPQYKTGPVKGILDFYGTLPPAALCRYYGIR